MPKQLIASRNDLHLLEQPPSVALYNSIKDFEIGGGHMLTASLYPPPPLLPPLPISLCRRTDTGFPKKSWLDWIQNMLLLNLRKSKKKRR
jgi:hypothetical protein